MKKTFLDNARGENWQKSYREGGSPGRPTIRRISDLFINEFMASNHSAVKNEAGNFSDWIELYNAGDQAVDVGGLYLSDDLEDPGLWRISEISPYMTTINPDSFLLLWADNDTTLDLLHLGFQLAMEGEAISIGQIVENDTILIDSLTYPEQVTDFSFGRYPDGSANWITFAHGTPGSSNIITGSRNEIQKFPGSFRLCQNYPNPFNPATVIRFSIPEAGFVTLKIYNLLGQLAATLVERNLAPGDHSYVWNAGSFASGVYYYKLDTEGGLTETKKLILLK